MPQGRILGPILFLVYLNDIFNVSVPGAELICYADDTFILFLEKSWPTLFKLANRGMSKVVTWLNKNLLTLNCQKSKYMAFQKTRAPKAQVFPELFIHSCEHSCNCPPTGRVEAIKYLGVILDENLCYKNHVSTLSAKIRRSIFIMKTLRNSACKKTLTLVYEAICQSALLYCISAWGGIAKSTLIELERAQRAVLKVMLRKPFRYSTNELYKESGVARVRQLYIQKVAVSIHKKIISSPEFKSLSDRRVFRIPLPTTRSSFAKRFPPYSHSSVYNQIAKTLKGIKDFSANELKRSLRLYLSNLDYMDTEAIITHSM